MKANGHHAPVDDAAVLTRLVDAFDARELRPAGSPEPCPYRAHRPSDWRSAEGGPVVCGRCHPPGARRARHPDHGRRLMPRQEAGERKRLRIVSSKQIAAGTGEHGPWRLFEVEATRPDGEPITGCRLISFEQLPAGEELDLLVERQDHPEHGVSYRLKRPRGSLAGRVEQVEARVRALTERLDGLERS